MWADFMPLKIKRVYDPPSGDDGARILVDRLWPRGLSKEKAQLALWLREVAPSNELRKWFGHEPEKWPEFRRRFQAEIKANPTAFARLTEQVKQGPATLVYAAADQEHNNARVLAELLGKKLKR